MCGITGGVWSAAEKALSAATLTRMADVLRHRGPDDDGYYRSDCQVTDSYGQRPGVALGFRRLSIIDLALASQPLSNEDGSVWVVFNGEIYNFAALRRRLEGAGHLFRTHGDGETIVHLYEDLGVECFSHFNGMFAIAIWDARHGRLVLGRDRLGKKPLVYHCEPHRLLFASELKSLLQVPEVSREIDPTALDHYLTYQYVPHPWTIFRGIRKLPPGHYAVYEGERITVEKYWTPDFNATWPGSEQDAIAALQTTLESSVQLRMQSDVPLGAFLSGGVDSSLIVALMQRLASQPVKTFSIGFPVREYDETSFARRVAAHLKTDHHEFQVTPDGLDILPRLVWHYDEPFADSSAIPTWYVSQLTRQHVTVALSGDGGDELFVGYPRYQAARFGMRLDRMTWLKRLLGAPIWQRLPASARQKSKLRQFRRFSAALGLSPARRYLDWISTFGVAPRHAVLGVLPGTAAAGGPLSVSGGGFDECGTSRSDHGHFFGRSADLFAVRPDDESRHCVDGPLAGVPAAFSGLPAGGTGGVAAPGMEISPRARQTHSAPRVWRVVAGRDLEPAEDGVRCPLGPLVPARTASSHARCVAGRDSAWAGILP